MKRITAVLGAAVAALLLALGAPAAHTPAPSSVTIAGSLQSELGCAGDWDPSCVASRLAYDAADGVWQRTWTVPAGSWEYKAALNGSWDENYGANAQPNGSNVGLTLAAGRSVTFLYDHATHWVMDNVTKVLATVPGSFQSELGCPGDWQPDCLRSWLQDPDGDGTYTFRTSSLPAGTYEAKVAVNQSWDENYGAGGAPGGANIPFTVPSAGTEVVFSYDAASHVLTIAAADEPDVEWDGLKHDSRDTVYRAPGGAVPAGTPVLLRFRTFHGDATAVRLRLWDADANAERLLPMALAAEDVSCYEPGVDRTCDFWQVRLANGAPATLWYRFVVSDRSDTDYYADDTAALDGGDGAPTDDPVDRSWALTVHEPGFAAPDWAERGVLYQIFPDRFRNGDRKNDPRPGTLRYGDLASTLKPWDALPEGYCRNYEAPSCDEGPMGRDYFGGDLKGVRQKLDYLRALGVTAIYFNPIFEANSNHRYDTADYTRVDPALGDRKELEQLIKQARERGIRVILDGVFNHMSSDSRLFDRYHRFPDTGACESAASPWRSWFTFTGGDGPCVGGGYDAWFGFDTIPTLVKSLPAVQDYFVGSDSITTRWLELGIGGWRLDVSGDPSFPDGYWERFRETVEAASPDALTISETWQKDTTLLRHLRGDRFDTTMSYRFRDAVLGLLSPDGGWDSKGFADSGRIISPTEFASRLASIREDYADAAYFSAMNLLGSHDTERLLWALTPGAETRADKEQNDANLAAGKARLRLASLVQFTVPGMPTVYYGDEVGVTGDDDPDDRRTMPWPDTGGRPDLRLAAHYTALSWLRRATPVLARGSLRMLVADDAAGVVVYGRLLGDRAAIVLLNRSDAARSVAVPRDGFVPAGTSFRRAYAVGGASLAGDTVELPALSGIVLLSHGADLTPPPAPAGVTATAGAGQASVSWSAVAGAAAYDVWVSPLSGGGYVKANAEPLTGMSFTATGLRNGVPAFVVVRALDEHGNASEPSAEVETLPHLVIAWANTQWPHSLTHTVSTTNRTETVYGQVYVPGATEAAGPAAGVEAELGYGPRGSDPATWETWVQAEFNVQVGNNDEYRASLLPDVVGAYDYGYRYTTTGGREWTYANRYPLDVLSTGDTTAPATPAGLRFTSASPAGIALAWDGVADAYGYEVRRAAAAAGPYETLELVTDTAYEDLDVAQGATYHYVVRAVDSSFNRSAPTAPLAVTAELRTVSVTFDVTVPATTDATGRNVHIAGTLARLDGGLPDWDPAGVPLTRVDATRWRVTLTGREATQLEYKLVLGDWLYVEKDAACGELANRQLTLAYGGGGTQTVPVTVANWRNVAPCGN